MEKIFFRIHNAISRQYIDNRSRDLLSLRSVSPCDLDKTFTCKQNLQQSNNEFVVQTRPLPRICNNIKNNKKIFKTKNRNKKCKN